MRNTKKKKNVAIYLSPIIVLDELLRGAISARGLKQAQVSVYIDGKLHTEITCRFPVSDTYRKLFNAPEDALGFVSPLPAYVFDGAAHELIVRHRNTSESTEDSTATAADPVVPPLESRLVYRHGDRHGQVSISDRCIKGWVAFNRRPNPLPALTLRDRKKNLIKQSMLIPLPTENGHPDQFMATFRIPLEDLPVPLHVYCGEIELSGSPCKLQKKPVGFLDKFNGSMFHGWAFDAHQLTDPVELALKIDGQIVQYFRPNIRRPDVANHLKIPENELGILGFNIAPPEILFDGEEHRIHVEFAGLGHPLRGSGQIVRIPKPYLSFEEMIPFPEQKRRIKAIERPANPMVSVIILNRNGEALLAALFESWEKQNSLTGIELIVVDHASEDGSLELIARWQSRIALHIIALPINDSFSASCNLAAKEARGQFLLFMNNDIVWLQDALPEMINAFEKDPQLGVLGIKLIKSSDDGKTTQQMPLVQHLGVRFTLNGAAYWPYEITPHESEAEHSPQTVPVVTGAVMLCRKKDFFDAGQFDTDFFYGFEDVEFCLRLSNRLNKKIICRNDLLALHHHGYTRLSGRAADILDRVYHNANVLQKNTGLWLKRNYWASLIRGDGYLTVEKLTIGIVIGAIESDDEATPLPADTSKLARQIRKCYPSARILFLPPRLGWYNARDIHLLIVGHPEYDIQMITSRRQDLLTLAWIRNDIRQWTRMPWWRHFDNYLVTRSGLIPQLTASVGNDILLATPESPLGSLFLNQLPPLRVASIPPPDMASVSGKTNMAILQQSLKAAGAIVWEEPVYAPEGLSRVTDVLIAVCLPENLSQFELRPQLHTLNILWVPDGKKPSRKIEGWKIVHRMPQMDWLKNEIEIALGNTFHSS